MGEFTWQQILLHEGKRHEMCERGESLLASGCAKEDAIRFYKKEIDWGLEEDFPRVDFLRKEFSGYEHLGICIDKNFNGDLMCDQLVYVFHHCTGTVYVDLNVSKRIIPILYFANGCDMTVKRTDDVNCIRVPIYIYGENKVRVVNNESVEFKVYNFDIKER